MGRTRQYTSTGSVIVCELCRDIGVFGITRDGVLILLFIFTQKKQRKRNERITISQWMLSIMLCNDAQHRTQASIVCAFLCAKIQFTYTYATFILNSSIILLFALLPIDIAFRFRCTNEMKIRNYCWCVSCRSVKSVCDSCSFKFKMTHSAHIVIDIPFEPKMAAVRRWNRLTFQNSSHVLSALLSIVNNICLHHERNTFSRNFF